MSVDYQFPFTHISGPFLNEWSISKFVSMVGLYAEFSFLNFTFYILIIFVIKEKHHIQMCVFFLRLGNSMYRIQNSKFPKSLFSALVHYLSKLSAHALGTVG